MDASVGSGGEVVGKIVIAVIAISFTISFVGLAELSFPNSQTTYLGIHEPVTIGTRCVESAALMYIAED
jgi:hypothetical protein